MRIQLGVENHETKFPTEMICFSVHKVDYEEKTTTSLINTLCTSEISYDSEGERLQLKAIHQTNPSVTEQSLNNSSYYPSFFKHISRFN